MEYKNVYIFSRLQHLSTVCPCSSPFLLFTGSPCSLMWCGFVLEMLSYKIVFHVYCLSRLGTFEDWWVKSCFFVTMLLLYTLHAALLYNEQFFLNPYQQSWKCVSASLLLFTFFCLYCKYQKNLTTQHLYKALMRIFGLRTCDVTSVCACVSFRLIANTIDEPHIPDPLPFK